MKKLNSSKKMVNGKSLLVNKLVWTGVLLLVISTFGSSHREADAYSLATGDSLHWKAIAEHLSDGDLVFRTGLDMVSQLVVSQGNSSRFSHVGIILKHESGPVVVHALPQDGVSLGGVLIEPLSVFSSSEKASDIAFYRVKGINTESRNEIRKYVLRQIGKPFDDDFLLSNDEKFYCSELALKALEAAGINLVTSVPKIEVMLITEPVVPPDYIRQSSQLEAITSIPIFERDMQKSKYPF